MTEQEQQKLKEQIFMLCEKQYRKGLVHGAKLIEGKKVYMLKLEDFRLIGSLENYKNCKDPIKWKPLTQEFIISNELNMAGMTELRKFLNL